MRGSGFIGLDGPCFQRSLWMFRNERMGSAVCVCMSAKVSCVLCDFASMTRNGKSRGFDNRLYRFLNGAVCTRLRILATWCLTCGCGGCSRSCEMFSVSVRPMMRSGLCVSRSLPGSSCKISPSIKSSNRRLVSISYLSSGQPSKVFDKSLQLP